MILMDLILDRKEILSDLHKISAHFGVKLSAPEIVASTDDDNDKIHLMLQAALMELLNLLSPYAELLQSGDVVTFVLKMPANWKTGRADNLTALCRDYLLHSLFARWLDFVKSDSAALYRTLNSNTAAAIVHILSLREKPTR